MVIAWEGAMDAILETLTCSCRDVGGGHSGRVLKRTFDEPHT